MILISNPDKSQWQEILKRPVMNTENLFDTVRSVIDRVKEEGDRAVRDYEEKFDKVVLASLAVSEEEQQEAENLVSEDLKAAIRLAKQNIETFHAAQRFQGFFPFHCWLLRCMYPFFQSRFLTVATSSN